MCVYVYVCVCVCVCVCVYQNLIVHNQNPDLFTANHFPFVSQNKILLMRVLHAPFPTKTV